MKQTHGHNGVWAAFGLAQQRNKLHLFLQVDAGDVLDDIITAASENDERLEMIVSTNHKLRILGYPGWPKFYSKVLYNLINGSDCQRALKFHQDLPGSLRPSLDDTTSLFSMLVSDKRIWVQKTLLSLYMSDSGQQLYDRVVPMLFERGQQSLARAWRKTFVASKDLPLSSRSQDFIKFMIIYFPQTTLDDQELAILHTDYRPAATGAKTIDKDGPQHDGLVAKWFASSWVSVDFAINIVYRLGTRSIGTRALQALALRESKCNDVAERIDQLERLGIQVASHPYCDAVRHMLKSGQDELLWKLLRCDIHPDEFGDSEKRRAFLDDARQRGDAEQTRLFQAVELALDSGPVPHQLNVLMEKELTGSNIGRLLGLLDEMKLLNVSISEQNAVRLLEEVFQKLPEVSTVSENEHSSLNGQGRQSVKKALAVLRQLAFHDIPLPLRYWELLLQHLGMTGQLNDFERVGLEFVERFRPPGTALVQVSDGREDDWEVGKHYIPIELPFSHRQHPLQLIFNPAMQRLIVEWGFFNSLSKARPRPYVRQKPRHPADFDTAGGVAVLASLRDQGLLIDPQVIQRAMINCVATCQAPEVARHWSRESQKTISEDFKALADMAWGDELLPAVAERDPQAEEKRDERIRREATQKYVKGERTWQHETDLERSPEIGEKIPHSGTHGSREV
jgi:hypothetical protein